MIQWTVRYMQCGQLRSKVFEAYDLYSLANLVTNDCIYAGDIISIERGAVQA